jgi:hypothetical protein
MAARDRTTSGCHATFYKDYEQQRPLLFRPLLIRLYARSALLDWSQSTSQQIIVMVALRAAHIEMWNRNFVDQLGWYVHKVGDAIDT